jgi:hypothetical protein
VVCQDFDLLQCLAEGMTVVGVGQPWPYLKSW